jgi:hypothetical protein
MASRQVAPLPRRSPVTQMLSIAMHMGAWQRSQSVMSASNADGRLAAEKSSAQRASPCNVFCPGLALDSSVPSLPSVAITNGMPKLHRSWPIALLNRPGSKVLNMNWKAAALLRPSAGSTASTW